MSEGRDARVWAVFHAALDLEPDARAAFVAEECAGDAELQAAVERLLERQAAVPSDFAEPPPFRGAASIVGQRLGPFTIGAEIGRGGMGVVHAARQESLDRDAAVKAVFEGPMTSAAALERFHREARAIARLTHPGIVRVFADGEQDGVHWFAMERIDGHDLATDLERQAGAVEGEPILPGIGATEHIPEAVRVVLEVAEGLVHAHAHGLVHRDVKPSNILLRRDGTALLADFGLARDERLGSLTQTGHMVGSMPYVSPEQARIYDVEVDGRTDVYSLGVVLYELLTSRLPFKARTSLELAAEMDRTEPPRLRKLNPRVPRDLELVCAQAMSLKLADRYPSAADFAADLRRFLGHEAVTARAPGVGRRAGRWLRRHRVAVAGVVIAVAAGVGGAWWSAWRDEVRAEQVRRDRWERYANAESWAQLSATELSGLRKEVLAAIDTGAAGGSAGRLLDRFDEYREGLERTIQREAPRQGILDAAAKNETDGAGVPRALQAKVRLAEIFDLEQDPTDARGLWPTVTIRAVDPNGRQLPGTVFIRRLDPATGEPGARVEFGALPLHEQPVEPGCLRFVVDVGDGVPREWLRLVDTGERLVLDGVVVHPAAPPDDMAYFEGGSFETWPLGNEPPASFDWRIAPFLLDRYEVSNADYVRFLADQPDDYPRPKYWTGSEPDAGTEDLPVVGVSWEQARDYAQWAGKRLPTTGEWLWAFRGGTADRETPWGTVDFPECYPRGVPLERVASQSQDSYLRFARPVQSCAEAATPGPERLHWMLGNVWEWVETPALKPGVSGPQAFDPIARNAFGLDWAAATPSEWPIRMRMQMQRRSGRPDSARTIGFRCARSVNP